MYNTKLLKKMIIPAFVILTVSTTGLILKRPYLYWSYKNHRKRLISHIEELTKKYQSYLNSVAKKIKSIPPNPSVINQIQSNILNDPITKQYIWMIDSQGNFTFGIPPEVFDRLNRLYDKYQNVIKNDGIFTSRNDFLSKLVDKHSEIDFSEFEQKEIEKNKTYRWRFYKEQYRLGKSFGGYYYNYSYYVRPRCFILSSPLSDSNNRYIGNLYMKIDDSENYRLYYNQRQFEQHSVYLAAEPVMQALAVLSLFFIWFLLPTWVYVDARERNEKNVFVWVLLTILSSIFGLAIYLIARAQDTGKISCPECHNELNGIKSYCPYCGFDLSTILCPQCQYPVRAEWKFCPSCRTNLKKGEEKKSVEKKK